MSRTLNVYLNKIKVGILTETNEKSLSFSYDSSNNQYISLSMKDLNKSYDDKIVRPFLENLLPEGNIIEQIAKTYLVSKNNPFSILSKIGEDCAGAISITDNGAFEFSNPERLSKDNFNLLLENNEKGISYYKKGMRLSLAGAQNKLTLLIKDGNYYLPNFNNPSTHIIKFNNNNFQSLLLNEYFSTKLASLLNLKTSNTNYKNDPYPYLLIERYDRKDGLRIHQEDFCQILAVRPQNKYQFEGGPSFKQIADTIKTFLPNPAVELINLSRILIFNYLIGNCDYHAKNLSVLYNKELELSPFYDLVSTYIYDDLSKDMAMSINKKYNIDSVTKDDIIKEFDSWGLHGKKMFSLILKELKEIVSISKNIYSELEIKHNDILKIINFIEKQYNKLNGS